MDPSWLAFPRFTVLLAAVLLLGGCSSGGKGDNAPPDKGNPPVVAAPVHGLDFSPYLDGQDPGLGPPIGEAQLTARMKIVAPYTGWVRTYGMENGLQRSGAVARRMGLQVALGAWISDDMVANDRQIANLLTAMAGGEADLAIVGSEVLLRGDLTEDALITYIQEVRSRNTGVPIAYAETHREWLAHPAVIDAVDAVLVNYYPYWEAVAVDQVLGVIHGWHQQTVAAAGGKRVIVSETGWPSDGDPVGHAVPSPENAAFYFLTFVSWAEANDVEYFYFEAFDETWKAQHEGPQGAHWGVWDKDGELKPGMQAVFDGERLDDNGSDP